MKIFKISALYFFCSTMLAGTAFGGGGVTKDQIGVGVRSTWMDGVSAPSLTVEKNSYFSDEEFVKSADFTVVAVDHTGKIIESRKVGFKVEQMVARCKPGANKDECGGLGSIKSFFIVMKNNPAIFEIRLLQGKKELAKASVN